MNANPFWSRGRACDLAVYAIALAVAACQAPPENTARCSASDARSVAGPSLGPSVQGPAVSAFPLDAVLYGDARTRHVIAVQNVATDRTATGSLRVRATLFNCADTTYAARARVTLLDARRQPVEPPGAWQSVLVSGGGLGWVEHIGTSAVQVDAFLIELGRDGP